MTSPHSAADEAVSGATVPAVDSAPVAVRAARYARMGVAVGALAVIALVSVSGVVSSGLAGRLSWALALPFAGAAVAGMLGGRALAGRMAGPRLQIGFAGIAASVACGMLVKALA